jgi:hypothetical protein
MGLMETIIGAAQGGAVKTVAKKFGLPEDAAAMAITHIVPHLSKGLQKNMETDEGTESLKTALEDGSHDGALDDPDLLDKDETDEDGKKILGHVMGSKDASRAAARDVAKETGIDEETLKKMMPTVAVMTMGGVKKQSASVGTKTTGPVDTDKIKEMVTKLKPGDVKGLLGMLGKLKG